MFLAASLICQFICSPTSIPQFDFLLCFVWFFSVYLQAESNQSANWRSGQCSHHLQHNENVDQSHLVSCFHCLFICFYIWSIHHLVYKCQNREKKFQELKVLSSNCFYRNPNIQFTVIENREKQKIWGIKETGTFVFDKLLKLLISCQSILCNTLIYTAG